MNFIAGERSLCSHNVRCAARGHSSSVSRHSDEHADDMHDLEQEVDNVDHELCHGCRHPVTALAVVKDLRLSGVKMLIDDDD